MHFTTRVVCAAAMVCTFVAACSSDKSPGTADGAVANNGTGGHGTGGSSNGSGGSPVPACAADAGMDGCRRCLANNCCDAYTQCLADPVCSKALTKQIACFSGGDEPSFCFGNFTRALAGDSGAIKPVPECIAISCTAACGGPGVV